MIFQWEQELWAGFLSRLRRSQLRSFTYLWRLSQDGGALVYFQLLRACVWQIWDAALSRLLRRFSWARGHFSSAGTQARSRDPARSREWGEKRFSSRQTARALEPVAFCRCLFIHRDDDDDDEAVDLRDGPDTRGTEPHSSPSQHV